MCRLKGVITQKDDEIAAKAEQIKRLQVEVDKLKKQVRGNAVGNVPAGEGEAEGG